MYLQGNLQLMFDALYHMGVIDPVLEMDWSETIEEIPVHFESFSKIINVANSFQEDVDSLMEKLENFDEKTLSFLAIEVAKEFADYHSRDDLQ